MKIYAEMSSEEYREFLRWKDDKTLYERELDKQYCKMEHMCQKLLWAVEEESENPANFVIISQDHLCELVDMANEFLI